ncbi:hypothetical protein DFH11DRAFT_254630 [Phellopilus nigrolimitatus]|nr:hypothetical protein DFH11DRAFT_254630 [Phellopilus nigrolimitatus]
MEGQPWERAVKQPTFEVSPQLPSSTGTPQPATTRNMKPCKTCADMRKKCNMSPPYSSGNCESCAMARVSCPPHNERRPRRRVARARVVQHSPLSASASDILQPSFPSGNEVAEVIHPQTYCAIVAPATNYIAETSSDDTAADAPASHIGGFNGPIIADEWLDIFSLFAPGSGDSFM